LSFPLTPGGGGPPPNSDGNVYADAPDPDYTLEYPWSANPNATGDYIADVYKGVLPGQHVIENVTTDRLLDILQGANTVEGSSYYILFAGPEHVAAQAVVKKINELAKATSGASEVSKIYHFDPYVDGYQLDSTGKISEFTDITGGTSVNFSGSAKISDVWKLITNALPASAIDEGGALKDYDGKDTLLISVKITDRTSAENAGKTIASSYKLTETTATAGGFNVSTQTDVINAVFTAGGKSAVRSQYSFFKRLYNASATNFNYNGGTATYQKTGTTVEIFKDTDFPNGAGFVLESIDIKETYNLLNSPGEYPILFAGQGCHNTQAIIGEVAKRAKALNTPKVYVVDFALDSNIKFGTGENIDNASSISATGGLWIRDNATSASAKAYSYLYGELAKYFGSAWVTENSSQKSNSIAYYPNGDLASGTLTTNPYVDNGNGQSPRRVDANPPPESPNARRLQVPTLIRYNKAVAQPVTAHWLHKNHGVVDTKTDTYTEYMLELAWVNKTVEAIANTGKTDGLTRVEFAAEAVKALDGVLVANSTERVYSPVIHTFTTAPAPTITGSGNIGTKVFLNEGEWSHSPTLTYKFLANGTAIPGATGTIDPASADPITYTVTAANTGKNITAQVTANRATYSATTKASNSIGPAGTFTKAPAPIIVGTAKVGNTLGLNTGTWAPWPSGAAFKFQWYANGAAISGATKNQLLITAALQSKKITVAVTATATGLAATTKTSSATAAVKGQLFAKSPTPKITGTAKVGKTLKINKGAWSPKPSFKYQWYANGKAIKGATKATLKLKAAQKNKKITVKITASKSGYEKKVVTSKKTAKVKK
jgi:hypothetical protein